MSNTFFTSDTHFFHKKILEYCPNTRKGKTVEEMNDLLVQAWNNKVSHVDTIYHLGDVSFGKHDETLEVLKRLNGKIHLILGNHDQMMNKGYLYNCFESIQDYKTIKIEGKHIVLFHFPIESWDRQHYGSVHLHGHVHGNTIECIASSERKFRMDVGVDTRSDMAPWAWEEIKEKLEI